jgi:glutathione S-transferase
MPVVIGYVRFTKEENMQLFWSSRSPFVRKVMVLAHELSIVDRFTLVRVAVGAASLNKDVMQHNPLNRIPTLVLDDGNSLFDSRVICNYLEQIASASGRFLPDAEFRIADERRQSLGDGIMEQSVLTLGERKRPAERFSPEHEAAYRLKTEYTLNLLEREADQLMALPGATMGSIAIAVALSHLDFRFGDEDWRAHRPLLSNWHASMADRPSMKLTAFVDI